MKKLVTKGFYIISAIILFIGATLPVNAQFSRTNVETGRLYTALTKDASNNLYVTRIKAGTGGATYEVVKYTNGTGSPVSIYSGLTHEAGDFPWGLAVTSTGNVFISTDFTSAAGSIIKLTLSAGVYTPSTFQTGRYFSALAIDASDNLYAAEYDAVHVKYAVVKYAVGSAALAAGTNLYDNLKSAAGYTYPTGLVVAANGDIYVADAFSNDPSVTDAGHVYKLTAASAYAASTVSTGQYATALTLDASGNLFSSENSGSGYKLVEYLNGTGSPSTVYTPLHSNGFYYPWGIAVYDSNKLYAIDGDDGTLGGAVMKIASANANLSSLSTSGGTLNPVFASATTAYTVTVPNATSSVTVTPTVSNAASTVTVKGTAVTSGTASGAIALNVGANAIPVVVTAPDGTTKKTYTVTVTRALSPNAFLASLAISSGTLSPSFTSGVTSYKANVTNATLTVTLTPTTSDANATITVNGAAVTSGTASGAITLSVGPNIITTIVTAQDGTTTKTYTATVTRAPSSNAVLTAIQVTPASTLTTASGPGYKNYTTSVPNGETSLTVTPTAQDPTATITVNGVAVNSGYASAPVALNVGPNTVTTVVTAQDGVTTKSYIITVTRAPSTNALLTAIKVTPASTLTPTSGPGYGNYIASVPNSETSLTVTATTQDPTATLTVNGVAAASGVASGSIPLTVGPNIITTVVTAQDGSTTKSYIITVTRSPSTNASLSNLAISTGTLTPTFVTGTVYYSASVANAVTSVTLTPTTSDATATVTVNGTAVASGSASGAIALNVGPNNIATVVTAQDGSTTQTYTVTVTRAASSNALLSNLAISSGTLTPVFATGTTSYTASVSNAVASLTVTPTTADATATVTVNGTTVVSGTASGAIPLVAGPNTITTVVTAQDGITTKTYTTTVTKAPSSNALLTAIKVTPAATLTSSTGPGYKNYTTSVANSVSSLTVTATTLDPTATLTVNGTAVASGTASGSIPLNVGPNTITTLVTAQDGVTTKSYIITVTRAPSSNALLTAIQVTPASTLATASGPGYKNYTTSVPNSEASLTVTATAQDPTATITVNGSTVASGAASASIGLAVGDNVINTIVTAQDGSTTKTYIITVTRAMVSGNSFYQPISVVKPTGDAQLGGDGIVVHQGVSPNGDGLSDFLVIENITAYPENNLSIMNRSGELVYEAKGYDNNVKIFDGHSNKNGKLQVAGTYFYSLDYKVGDQTKHKTGFIIIKY